MYLHTKDNSEILTREIVAIVNSIKSKQTAEIIDIANNRYKINTRVKTLIKKIAGYQDDVLKYAVK
ncbi:MAG: hypothetical protein ABH952_09180 [Candidatus Omnitrophota bacterium]